MHPIEINCKLADDALCILSIGFVIATSLGTLSGSELVAHLVSSTGVVAHGVPSSGLGLTMSSSPVAVTVGIGSSIIAGATAVTDIPGFALDNV